MSKATSRRPSGPDALLRALTETVQKHETKLALDYQSIQILNKDTDQVTRSVNKLSGVVSEMAGAMKIQSTVIHSILAVTLVAFIGATTRTIIEAKRSPGPQAMTKELATIIKNEIESQGRVVPASAPKKRKHRIKSASSVGPWRKPDDKNLSSED